MRMIWQLPPPGVQDTEKARPIGAERLGIERQGLDGRGRGIEQGMVGHRLMVVES